MAKAKSRTALRKKRRLRLRKRVLGTTLKPRLSMFKSLKQIYAQLVDDSMGNTLVSVSTLSKEYKDKFSKSGKNIEAAKNLGKLFAEKMKKKKIPTLCFDRSGYKFHGGVKAFADSIREEGIAF